jgi:hypothetical protein
MWLANEDYKASDHKMMGILVTLDEPIIDDDSGDDAAGTTSHHRDTETMIVSSIEEDHRRQGKGGVRARRHSKGSVAAAPPPSSSSAASFAPRFAPKSSSTLRRLMPLTRSRPGIATSSLHAHILLPQLLAFWATILGLVWLVYTLAGAALNR